MANSTASKTRLADTPESQPLTAMAILAPLVGWLVPGAGHLESMKVDPDKYRNKVLAFLESH